MNSFLEPTVASLPAMLFFYVTIITLIDRHLFLSYVEQQAKVRIRNAQENFAKTFEIETHKYNKYLKDIAVLAEPDGHSGHENIFSFVANKLVAPTAASFAVYHSYMGNSFTAGWTERIAVEKLLEEVKQSFITVNSFSPERAEQEIIRDIQIEIAELDLRDLLNDFDVTLNPAEQYFGRTRVLSEIMKEKP